MKKIINILFLIQDGALASSRVRVCNLLEELGNYSIKSEVKVYPSKLTEKVALLAQYPKFDAIFLQKKLLNPLDAFLIRMRSNYLIFDFDDAIYCKHDSTQIDKHTTSYRKFKSVISKSDLIIAGNKILKEVASEINQQIEIIPSSVFVKNIPQKDYSAAQDKVIIGWVGGKVNLPYLKLLAPILSRLSKKYPIQLNIICNKELYLDGVDIKFIPWDIKTQDREIANFDIGVMPLADSLYTRGKCGYKILQYMAASVPAVVSDVGVNRDIVENGKLGLIAKSIEDFYPALEQMITSSSLRRDMGENSRTKIVNEYSVEAVARNLAKIITKHINY